MCAPGRFPLPSPCAHVAHALTRLTDETIRQNWLNYNNPDGRQEVSMGIALPKWIVESSNNIWVLGVYGIIFGGALPAMVVSGSLNPDGHLGYSLLVS